MDAVNAVLSAGSVEAEYMNEPSVGGATDIVYTMPTKPLLVSTTGAAPPFAYVLAGVGACESSEDWRLSREEQLVQTPDGGYFPELRPFAAMCWASTVQSFNAQWPNPTAVVGSCAGLRYFLGSTELFPTPLVFTNGVATQVLSGRPLRPTGSTTITDLLTGQQTSSPAVSYFGLPIVGVSMVRYVNGTLDVGGVATLSTYGTGGAVRAIRKVVVE